MSIGDWRLPVLQVAKLGSRSPQCSGPSAPEYPQCGACAACAGAAAWANAAGVALNAARNAIPQMVNTNLARCFIEFLLCTLRPAASARGNLQCRSRERKHSRQAPAEQGAETSASS